MNDFEIGFAIGLIVGGGSFTGDRNQPALSVKLHQRDREPLDMVQRLLGGSVYGPYDHSGRQYCIWHLRGGDLRRALPLFRDRLPACQKRNQFDAWAERYAELLGPGESEEGRRRRRPRRQARRTAAVGDASTERPGPGPVGDSPAPQSTP